MSDERPTLIFGFVAAVGTNLAPLIDAFASSLRAFDYEPISLHLTNLLIEHVAEKGSLTWANEAERLERLMTAGDQLREQLKRGDAMALLSCFGIATHSQKHSSAKPNAFLIRQLKHPEEIAALRRVYGDRFFAIAIYSTFNERLAHLRDARQIEENEARRLIRRDEEDETNEFGQRTRDTFALADVFIRLNESSLPAAQDEAQRFLDLIFGRPDLSPKATEHAMYLAYAASLRSADLSRQVGAAIVSELGDVVAVGANDVPQAGGGQYWPGKKDRRDHRQGYDSNQRRKMEIAKDIFDRTHPRGDEADFERFLKQLDGSLLLDITEYGRAVHAEMEALLACARAGTSTRRATLFTTTFPCHNCAKHIVDAGITEVVYVEPYPKSLASPLHGDAIHSEEHEDSGEPSDGKVMFRHYVGVGPRRYLDLFSLSLGSGRRVKRKTKKGDLSRWERHASSPRVPSEMSSQGLEALAIHELSSAMENVDED
jgi:deoxycytidylate deaminase